MSQESGQPRQQSRIGCYYGGCFVLLLVLVAAVVLGVIHVPGRIITPAPVNTYTPAPTVTGTPATPAVNQP